jgi:pimeloyl-ACP methyl ester carboxylesterase
VLDRAGVHEPVILVGHSFGGLLARHFVARYPERVAGLVLADPLLPCEWHPMTEWQAWRLGKGVMLARRGATLARIGVVRLALDLLVSGSILIPKLLAKASSGRGSVVTDRIVGEVSKLPPDVWPIIKAHWCLPRSFRTLAEYLARLPENAAFPIDDAALHDVPLVVLSAENADERVLEGHRALASLSVRGTHQVARGSGHWLQIDAPGIIAEAVWAVARAAASG